MSAIAAGLYFVWALICMITLQIAWFELRAGRQRGWLNHLFMTINRLAAIYFGMAMLIELTPTEFGGRHQGIHTHLLALSNLAAVGIGPLFRHLIPLLPVAAPPPRRLWLAINYGSLVPAAGLALLPLWTPPTAWLAATAAVHGYVFAMLGLGAVDAARLERRDAWPARNQPDVVIGNRIALVGWACAIAGGIGMLATRGAGGAPTGSWLLLLRSGVGLAAVLPFAVRVLEQILSRVVIGLALIAAVALYFGANAASARALEPETRRLLQLAAIWCIVLLLAPGQAWLRRAVDRVILRRSRRRREELQGALHDLSPELGVEECARRALAELARATQLRGAAVVLPEGTIAHGAVPAEALRRLTAAEATGGVLPARTFSPRELPDAALARLMLDEGIVLGVPLASRRRRWGHVVIIPGRVLGTLFRDDDVRTLEAFADQLALVLDAAELLARALGVERSLAHAEKLAAVGETAARIAHDIRNPVTAARSLAQQLCREAGPPLDEPLRLVLGELERVERLVVALLGFSRREEFRFEPVDLGELVRATVETLRPRLESGGTELTLDVGDGAVTHADREKLRQVLANVLDNAIDALASAGASKRLAVSVARVDGCVAVSVADSGPGVPADALPRLFEPFFSLKANGTGLGLAIAKRTVDAHGGRISAVSAPGSGLTVRIDLPADARA